MPGLSIIRASAGSGKTFSLASEYLILLLKNPESYRHILAITFTNKATEEMKSRIIGELHLLSAGKHTPQLGIITRETGQDEAAVMERAKLILTMILHDYSRFSVCTIDSFFQKIIRSFTSELGIQSDYSIELETEPVIKGLVEMLLESLENDPQLLAWFSGFAESLIEKGESWNFRLRIENLGKEIFREEFSQLPEPARQKFSDRELILRIRSGLYASTLNMLKEYSSKGLTALGIMSELSLSVEDFSYKEKGVAGYLTAISKGEFKGPGMAAKKAAGDCDCWYPKNSARKEDIIKACNQGLMALLEEALKLYDIYHKQYNTSQEILKNLYTLGILSDLVKNVSAYCNENNIFILPEASSFISKIIQDNDTPFIYEKAGYWYQHFMIDEFQDTSKLQWNNLKPLINNSLSQGYDNLIVGDVKQSIYRWRNSNWEILANEIESEYSPGVRQLKENRRSAKNIVAFNNAFFLRASAALQEKYLCEAGNSLPAAGNDIARVYEGLIQQSTEKTISQGIVTINFLPCENAADYSDMICEELICRITHLQEKGYHPSQIAILTRYNAEAGKIAEVVLRYKVTHPDMPYSFDVISDEALHLSGSSSVSLIASLLKHLADPNDKLVKYTILCDYVNYIKGSDKGGKVILPEELNSDWENSFFRMLPEGFSRLSSMAGRISLTETVERIIILFGLDKMKEESVYIQAFQDLVLEFTARYASDLVRFVTYWEETGKDKAVSAPSVNDAIRILTIHKAKGLEFDIVIIPFCNWNLSSRKEILWCGTEEGTEFGLDVFPVPFTNSLRDTYFSGSFYEELRRQYVDNLNLLYVAFTRARKGLMIYCQESNKQKEEGNLFSNVGEMMSSIINDNKPAEIIPGSGAFVFNRHFNSEKGVFSYGELPPAEDHSRESHNIPAADNLALNNTVSRGSRIPDIHQKLRISFRQTDIYFDETSGKNTVPASRGKIMHEIFSNIYTKGDIIPAVNKLYLQGKIDAQERDILEKKIAGCFNDLQVLSWFSGEWKVFSEAEIIVPSSHTRRPDRVLTKGERATVVDFKFGSHKKTGDDRSQVKDYTELLSKMGYVAEGYLWYVEQDRIVQV